MRRVVLGLISLLILGGCDRPDQVYKSLPKGYDPLKGNGLGPIATHFTGTKGFKDETLTVVPTVPTTQVCTYPEVSAKQAQMVNEPIIPMKGAGGLDMTGGADWKGLTIDEVQSKDVLCQAGYYGDGVAAWGDNYELIVYFDTTTRLISDIVVTPGYMGTIAAGDYVLAVNEPIVKAGVKLDRGDGSDRDARTEDNMRALDRAFIKAFRPSLDADQVDCVASGSCYIIMSGTLPVLVFMSVGTYVVLEPLQHRIVDLELSLKRPFRIGAGSVKVEGLQPTIYGSAAAGIPDCLVTWGTQWKDLREKCMGDDPMAMATVQAANGYENIVVHMGGVLLYFERPGLANDEILPVTPVLDDGDTVTIVSVNAEYEGDFSMPYSDILSIYKTNLDAIVRAEVPDLAADASTGVDLLRTPDDPNLPTNVQHGYPDRLRPGGVYAVFCEPDLDKTGKVYATCYRDSAGRYPRPLVGELSSIVALTLGDKLTPRLAEASLYVQEFERALAEHFNGKPILGDQNTMSPDAGAPDRIYATTMLFTGDDSYTVNAYYGGNDDRLHFLNFQSGATRMERVLLKDAKLPTVSDFAPSGVFTMQHLASSPRLGLGATGKVTVDHQVLETRRALLNVDMGDTGTVQVLAPYLAASAVSGYWLPVTGPQDRFVPADFFRLYGNTIDAGFWMLPATPGSEDREVVAIQGNAFFGDVAFCGLQTRVGAYASDLLSQIEAGGYSCNLIVRKTQNREFVSSIADLDSQVVLGVANDMVTSVLAWLR